MSEEVARLKIPVIHLPSKWDSLREWMFMRQTHAALMTLARAIKKLQTDQAEKEAATGAIRAQLELLEVFEKLARVGGTVTREQAAAVLNTSTKKIQRLEGRGKLRRCPDLEPLVRYPASDVLRLASADGR